MSAMWSASSRTAIGAVAQVDRAALDEVVEAARGGDEQVDAAVQGVDLGLVRHAAGDELVAQAEDVHQRLERVGDLHGQLAGRGHDQGPGPARRGRGAGGQAGQGRQAEGERLAGAGLAAAEDVLAGQRVRDGRGLDRERRGDAVTGQALDELLGQAQGGEAVVLGHGHRRLVGRRRELRAGRAASARRSSRWNEARGPVVALPLGAGRAVVAVERARRAVVAAVVLRAGRSSRFHSVRAGRRHG